MQRFSNNDSKFDLLRKILQNQTEEFEGNPNAEGFVTLPDIIVDDSSGTGHVKQGVAYPTPNGVLLAARAGNKGTVYIGGPQTTNGTGTRQGIPLFPGGMPNIRWSCADASQTFVNADNNGDGVSVVAPN